MNFFEKYIKDMDYLKEQYLNDKSNIYVIDEIKKLLKEVNEECGTVEETKAVELRKIEKRIAIEFQPLFIECLKGKYKLH